MFEVQSQQPGNFSLHVQGRVRGVQLVLQASHLRLERAHLRIQRVAFGRFRAALLRGQLPQRALAPRLAPSRQMRAVQPLAAKQAAHLAGLRAAIRLLQNPQPILEHARRIFTSLSTRNAYPRDADSETRQFTRYWFDDYARRQLTSLATAIERTQDRTIRAALWCAFSRLIISKQSGASLAMDMSHSRPHRKFKRAPAKPFRKFLSAVGRVTINCIDDRNRIRGPAAQVYEGDARHLDLLDRSIDLVITSPPYLNAIDYLRCSKFSLVWMGYPVSELRRLRSTTVGTEVGMDARDDREIQRILSELKLKPKLQARQEAMLARYINDMQRAVSETSRVLTDDGRAVYVVGENTVRGTFIPNAKVVEAVASIAGFR